MAVIEAAWQAGLVWKAYTQFCFASLRCSYVSNSQRIHVTNPRNFVKIVSRILPYLDSKVHGANMGPTWVLSVSDGPHEPCYQGSVSEATLKEIKNRGWCRTATNHKNSQTIWKILEVYCKITITRVIIMQIFFWQNIKWRNLCCLSATLSLYLTDGQIYNELVRCLVLKCWSLGVKIIQLIWGVKVPGDRRRSRGLLRSLSCPRTQNTADHDLTTRNQRKKKMKSYSAPSEKHDGKLNLKRPARGHSFL